MNKKPKVALISTGGTITSMSTVGELDLFEYSSTGIRLDANQMLEKFHHCSTVSAVKSGRCGLTWQLVIALLHNLVGEI